MTAHSMGTQFIRVKGKTFFPNILNFSKKIYKYLIMYQSYHI